MPPGIKRMWKLWLLILLIAVTPVFGQLESNTLAITANRSVTLQPNDVTFTVLVGSSGSTDLDQVVAAVSALGISSANLTSVSGGIVPPSVQWNFTLAVPIAKLATTIGSLTQLQQNITQNNSGLTLTFTVQGTQASQLSQKLQQSQPCSSADLIADATAQGQKLTAAAGLTLGPIIRLSNAPSTQPTLFAATFAVGGFIVPSILFESVPQSATCSLVVKFQLLQ
jgi:hypothetical protein